jgi:hypothetical protein
MYDRLDRLPLINITELSVSNFTKQPFLQKFTKKTWRAKKLRQMRVPLGKARRHPLPSRWCQRQRGYRVELGGE